MSSYFRRWFVFAFSLRDNLLIRIITCYIAHDEFSILKKLDAKHTKNMGGLTQGYFDTPGSIKLYLTLYFTVF